VVPSASNRQEWRFVVVQDAGKSRELALAANSQSFLAEAVAVIVCCAATSDHMMPCGIKSFAVDVSIAIDHLTLAAARGGEKCYLHGFAPVDSILTTDLPLQNNGNPESPSQALFDEGYRYRRRFPLKLRICVTVFLTYFQTRNLFLLTMIIRVMQLLLFSFSKTRKDLFLTIAVVKKENEILKRNISFQKRRIRLQKQDRVFLTISSRLSQLARGAVSIVQPETLLAWYRRLSRRFWTFPSKQPGRPRTPMEIRELVLKMKNENILWGNGKIQGELLKLGIELDRRTIARIIADFRVKGRIQNGITWSKFIKSHVESLFATDFFTVDSLFWKRFYVFFILALKTRKIIQFSITSNPTREFVRQQMILFDEKVPGGKHLIHDNSPELKTFDYESYGIKGVSISAHAPNMNCFAERS
jgi:putative transposase